MNDPLNAFKCLYVEQLLKVIQQQSEQIENQKAQINALIKSQQNLLESIKPSPFPPVLIPQNWQSLFNITQSSNLNAINNEPTSQHEQQNSEANQANNPAISSSHSSDSRTPRSNSSCYRSDSTSIKCPLNKENMNWKKEPTEPNADNVVAGESILVSGDHNQQLRVIEVIDDDEEEDLIEYDDNNDNNCNNNNNEDDNADIVGNDDDLLSFATNFKRTRIELGFTQRDVGVCLGLMQGRDVSQATLSRFEAGNLSRRNMIKLRPLLERWLVDLARDGRELISSRVMEYYRVCQQHNRSVDDLKHHKSTDVNVTKSPNNTISGKPDNKTINLPSIPNTMSNMPIPHLEGIGSDFRLNNLVTSSASLSFSSNNNNTNNNNQNEIPTTITNNNKQYKQTNIFTNTFLNISHDMNDTSITNSNLENSINSLASQKKRFKRSIPIDDNIL